QKPTPNTSASHEKQHQEPRSGQDPPSEGQSEGKGRPAGSQHPSGRRRPGRSGGGHDSEPRRQNPEEAGGVMRLAALLLVAGALAGCARNPATGHNELMLVSESQEIQMGQQYDSQVVATIGLYPDPALQSYIQTLGKRLAATSERPNLPWTFRVVDDPAVNAFAVPGGFVYVTRGILAHMNNEAQLATVVGHEIGHVTARHTAAEMSKEQVATLGLVVGSIANKQVAQYAGVAQQALSVLFLKFSRDNENQAYELGVRYSSRDNFDSREMVNVMKVLDPLSATEGGRLPEWLSTHPNPGNRVEHISSLISKQQTDFTGATINREGYERKL